MSDDEIWRAGSPPHVGWWNASTDRSQEIWRWWDGKRWSTPVGQSRSSDVAAVRATHPERYTWSLKKLVWRDFWPEGARVPRIDPRNKP